MRCALMHLALALTLACSACAPLDSQVSAGGTSLWMGSGYPSPYRTDSIWSDDLRLVQPGYGLGHLHHPTIACDAFGRCWRLGPAERFGFANRPPGFGHGYRSRPPTRPPGWADKLPDRAHGRHRFVGQRSRTVCDRATSICYKRGNVDKSATQNVFGERAGDRADDLRDKLGTARLFVPERGVACDRGRRACFEGGEPDRSLTRRYFGRRAAKKLD